MLIFFLVLLVVYTGAMLGRLPFWAGQVAWVALIAWNLIDRLPQIVRGFRSGEFSLGLPRIDPDYSRRR